MPDFNAGEHAFFVWSSFAATAVAFGWMIADTLVRARRWKREVERLSRPADGE
jgi:heme exporter protein D